MALKCLCLEKFEEQKKTKIQQSIGPKYPLDTLWMMGSNKNISDGTQMSPAGQKSNQKTVIS